MALKRRLILDSLRRRPLCLGALCALLLCLTGVLTSLTAFSQPKTVENIDMRPPLSGRLTYESKRYLLGPGDVLKLEVLGEPDYTHGDILVNPDGYASILGVGEVEMNGRTMNQVTDEIMAILQKTLVAPQISLTLSQTKPGTVYLSGAVMQPGAVQFATDNMKSNIQVKSDKPLNRTNMTLTNVLANAGGVSLNADLSNVQVRDVGTGKITTVNLWQVLKNGVASQDLFINSGDSIHIPEMEQMALSDEEYEILLRSTIGPQTFNIRVIGEVQTPGLYKLDGDSPFLNSAIAMAGGFAPQAKKEHIAIRRFTTDNQFTTLFVTPEKTDMTLRPNDVIYIAENKVYKSGRFMEQVSNIFKPFQTMASVGSYSAQTFGIGGWDRANF